jgi:hypothetical protein
MIGTHKARVTLLAIALVASGLPGAIAGGGFAAAATTRAVPASCGIPLANARSLGATGSGVRRGVLTLFGRSVRINPSTIDFSRAPVRSAPWRLWYGSLVWLVPLAVDSLQASNVAGRRLVAAYVAASLRTSPDPGSGTPAALARALRTGWAEATNTRRQQTLNCLVQIQPGWAVRTLLNATIRANLDPRRYYGPPFAPAHNHGLMANHALITSGLILHRQPLITIAARRLSRDVQSVRDRGCGMTFEQSARYHRVNTRLWQAAADRLAAVGRPRAAAAVEQAAIHMRSALAHLVAPDGALVTVGDSSPERGLPTQPQATMRMLCRAAGWAAGRTSWTPDAMHYTLRFGPRTALHGHNDHGSLTWARDGAVLDDPGYFYDHGTTVARYGRSNAAHNVLAIVGTEFSGPTRLLRAAWRPGADTYTVRDQSGGVTRTRSVWIDRELSLVIVIDRAAGHGTRTFVQRWHLAREWTRTSVPGVAARGGAQAGFIAFDVHTRRFLPRRTATALVFPTARTTGRGLVLSTHKRASSISIVSVVFRGAPGQRPILRWTRGPRAGTGTIHVSWGSVVRSVKVDLVGILPG